MAVSRSQYTAARRLVRQNGICALRWLPKDVRECVEAVHFSHLVDQLALRMDRPARRWGQSADREKLPNHALRP